MLPYSTPYCDAAAAAVAQVSSAQMGRSAADSVVDPRLRVHGIVGLLSPPQPLAARAPSAISLLPPACLYIGGTVTRQDVPS